MRGGSNLSFSHSAISFERLDWRLLKTAYSINEWGKPIEAARPITAEARFPPPKGAVTA
jgi:hypothetical protein